MVIVEWSGYENTPKEFPDNTVYSDHYAFKNQASLDKYLASLAAHPEVDVPLFLGEMKAGEDNTDAARWMALAMNRQGWSWAIWTYKGVDNGGWAAMNYGGEIKCNLARDSYESILKKWTVGLSQWHQPSPVLNLHPTKWWIDGFGQGFKAGPASTNSAP